VIMKKKFRHIKNKQQFVERAHKIHDHKYDYSKVIFPQRPPMKVKVGTCRGPVVTERVMPKYYRFAKIVITCPKHGEFTQVARKHINGSGCSLCGRENITKASYNKEGVAEYKSANLYEDVGDMIVIRKAPSDGVEREVLISKEDEEILSIALWHTTGHQKSRTTRTEYCVTHQNKTMKIKGGYSWLGSKPKMHRLIMSRILDRELHKDEFVDHINNNGLDNRRENLRVCTESQNHANVGKIKRRNGTKLTSKYKGVYQRADVPGRWYAKINPKGRRENLGGFETEEGAARAYDKRAIEEWGEFAQTNFKSEGE